MNLPTQRSSLDGPQLAELYDRHGRFLLRYLMTLTFGDAHLAEDIMQETFLRAWRKADLSSQLDTCRPWLVTVARNIVVDRLRHRRCRPQEASDAALPFIPSPHCEAERVVTSLTVNEAVAKLTPNRRAVVVHMYFHGRSPDETASVLGIPVGTVKSRVNSALRALRSQLVAA
ncbi:sigma-70 family RNA polymerase sigma factor [Lentzea tibetensis]|uniref:Sigma-70 family RNA polymerase sigma factor n=1 Tax=Lentzea tibetensis TaxID=2591470 RepID=A0A563ESG8_9PSEU|nr:sigma-70 family RNA polymerase sigma factor [Lentzea tibetensis]TWP50616.1 sigma-70 family RNA polymerase sigma factor [Lentzea tibetensis]